MRQAGFRVAIIALLAASLTLSASAGISQAAPLSAPSPALALLDAQAYRNIVADGDLFVLVRYNLPITGSPNWCSYLNNTAGCSDTPPAPEEPTSLLPGLVWLTLYSDNGATLEVQVSPPRIDHALGGLYVPPGHSLSWPPDDLRACIEAEPTAWDSPPSKSCLTPGYDPSLSASMEDQRLQLGQDTTEMVRAVEQLRLLPLNSFVISGASGEAVLTTPGRILALEALAVMDRVAPEIFQAATQQAFSTPYATPGVSNLQAMIDATAAAASPPGQQGFAQIGDNLGGLMGLPGRTFWTVVWLVIGLLLGMALYFLSARSGSGEPMFIPLGLFGGAMIGLWTGGPRIAAVFLALFIIVIFAVFGWIKRHAPTGG